MAAAATPVARPSLVSVFTGFLALVGLGPSTGAGTPSFPFVPHADLRRHLRVRAPHRIDPVESNPHGQCQFRRNPTTGQLVGQVDGDDEDDDTLTYTVSSSPCTVTSFWIPRQGNSHIPQTIPMRIPPPGHRIRSRSQSVTTRDSISTARARAIPPRSPSTSSPRRRRPIRRRVTELCPVRSPASPIQAVDH